MDDIGVLYALTETSRDIDRHNQADMGEGSLEEGVPGAARARPLQSLPGGSDQ